MIRRRLYESDEDRRRQREVMDIVSAWYSKKNGGEYSHKEMAELIQYDYELQRDRVTVALFEVKCRTKPRMTYPDYTVSARKMRSLSSQGTMRGLDAMLAVSWPGEIGIVDSSRALARGFKSYGGRSDRNDPHDMESMLHVPYSMFEFIDLGEIGRPST